jgi:hypothetical protein
MKSLRMNLLICPWTLLYYFGDANTGNVFVHALCNQMPFGGVGILS